MATTEQPQKITLVRLSSWAQVKKICNGDGDADINGAYFRDHIGELSPIFLKALLEFDKEGAVIFEESRLYVDFKPRWARGRRTLTGAAFEAAQERHDNDDTKYFYFDGEGGNCLFTDHAIFIEVEQ